jgi:2-amino-4-hydroxy-6-hydroxymethyldihydropteridine diphosphokinase
MAAAWLPAYVAVGGNLDRPRERVTDTFGRLAALEQTRVELVSRLYLTQPLGPQDQPNFVNAAVGLLTRLNARELLDALLGIERDMGRDRGERWGPRIIDLDLVWMIGEPLIEPGLQLPHPGVSERNFVLYPLRDIAPTLSIPGHGTVMDLAARVSGAGISVLERE